MTSLPKYLESEYERISHENNKTRDVRIRKKDEDNYIAVDFETGVATWGENRDRAIFTLGQNWILYRQNDRSGEIVSTEDTLGGDPRVDGSRIGVEHIVNMAENVDSIAELAARFSGLLTVDEAKTALEWADKNKNTMDELHRERELYKEFLEQEWNEEMEGVYTPDDDTPSFEEWKDYKNKNNKFK